LNTKEKLQLKFKAIEILIKNQHNIKNVM